jgi:hypothetical protein
MRMVTSTGSNAKSIGTLRAFYGIREANETMLANRVVSRKSKADRAAAA